MYICIIYFKWFKNKYFKLYIWYNIFFYLYSIVSYRKCSYPYIRKKIQSIMVIKEQEEIININGRINQVKENIYNNNYNPPRKNRINFVTDEEPNRPNKRYHRQLKSTNKSLSSIQKFKLNDSETKNQKKKRKRKWISTVLPTPAPPKRPILPPLRKGWIRSMTLMPV